ncbi:helix-turn-helix domain-containing protein [Pseudomonas sp. LS-2]|uniref:helix-turn-helix domain-containing protein n=1 Tax=Pseudomonas sp. LS-2 TaxID=2315859 RepID=UPI001404A60F|nr:helix-turn-helix domain-containing protein [Pseudomonas sp. LS-2]
MTTEQYPDIPPAFRWHAIKVALSKKGHSLKSLSKASGVTGIASAGKKNYPAAQTVIARALGVEEKVLFPERYDGPWTGDLQRKAEGLMPGLFALPTIEEPKPLFIAMVEEHALISVEVSDMPAQDPARLSWIKSALRERGFVLGTLASHIGVPRSALDNLGSARSAPMQALVATCLGVAPQALWPERYDERGEPIQTRRKADRRQFNRRQGDRRAEYQLDLTEGLWLPIRDLTGLPGMGSDVTLNIMHGENLGWKMRERFGVVELAFESLPVETKNYLLGPTSGISFSDPDFSAVKLAAGVTRMSVRLVDGAVKLVVPLGAHHIEVALDAGDAEKIGLALVNAANSDPSEQTS